MENVVRNEKINEIKRKIISVEDFKKYFHGRKIIAKQEYEEYLKYKNKSSGEFPDFFPTQFSIT